MNLVSGEITGAEALLRWNDHGGCSRQHRHLARHPRTGCENPESLALVSTIIHLAHSMKLNVVAEGVETEEQSRPLRLLNCDEIQGYLFSRPLARDAFEAKYLGAPALSQ
jgi:EAL domain-containing protein (putative c-di-GMP-specific phosphodiesterase class I)